MKNKKLMWNVFSFILILDFIIKKIVINKFELGNPIPVIENFFNLTYVRNFGAAWSLFFNQQFFLIGISIIAVFALFKYFMPEIKTKVEYISFGILLGGIFGNLIDRIFYGFVIDYLDFNIFGYDFPVFNLADIAIVLGISVITIKSLKGGQNEE